MFNCIKIRGISRLAAPEFLFCWFWNLAWGVGLDASPTTIPLPGRGCVGSPWGGGGPPSQKGEGDWTPPPTSKR